MELDERYFFAEEVPDEDEFSILEAEPSRNSSWRCL